MLSVKTPDHSHIERYHGARLLRVPVGSGDLRSRMESFDRAVRRQLESEEYLLVHFFDPVSGYPLCERRGDFGYKLVYGAYRFPSSDLPSLLPGEGANKRLLARSRRQELFCLMNADAVVVGSEAARTHCLGLGVPEATVNVVRAPVDLAPFSPEVMGKPDGVPTRLIHLGSHGKHQDLFLLLEALAKTKTAVKLALVGPSSPELTPALKERTAELKLTERVEFQEPVNHDDLHKVLAAADVGVLTLTDEPRNRAMTPLARIGEFLAAGRPIIAADLPLTRELVPAAAARFYTPGNADSLAEAIDALAEDPAMRCTMGAAGRTAAWAIDSNVVCEQLIALYRRVAPGAAVPADAHVDDVDPSDATQLGAPAPDELTQAVKRAPGNDSQKVDVGTNKVKTDPAAMGLPPEADTGTDQGVARGRPPVMGVLLRDDAPPVPVESTDPAVVPGREAPVVMGLPITDRRPDVDAVEAPPPREPLPVADDEARAAEAAVREQPSVAPAPAPSPQVPPSPPSTAPAPAPGPAAISTPSATINASDDEPLDFVAMLRPSAPARSSSIPLPDITAPNPPAVPRAPAPIPIAVPTSFSLAANRAGAPPGATFVPVPFGGVPVSTVPARVTTVPLNSAGVSAPSGVRPSAPPLPSSPSGLHPGPPPLFGGQGASPSGVRPPLTAPAEAPGSTTSGLRPPPLAAPAEAPGSTTSGVRAAPAVSAPAPAPGSTTSGVRLPPAASAPTGSVLPAPAPGVASTPSTVRAAAPEALPPMVRLVPNPSPGGPPLLTKEAAASHDEVVEVHEDEVELVNDESFLSMHDGDEHEEIDEGELHALETSAAPPHSSLDPWFAQLVHGYCPPESQLFTRHVPPTTMPGRDT